MTKKRAKLDGQEAADYGIVLGDVAGIIEAARRCAVRRVNAVMTAAYWLIGRRIVEFEQGGAERAAYGEELMERLARDLTAAFGRGFGKSNLFDMRAFYLAYAEIFQTLSGESPPLPAGPIIQTASGKSEVARREFDPLELAQAFPLSWSHYVLLVRRSRSDEARRFYETEAIRGGWSVRQLHRQINSQFYERTALSKNKAAMLRKGEKALPEDAVAPEEAIKDPTVLEFLDLKDEYSETDLEEALIRHLEAFLLELGGDFCFIGRQKRLRIGNSWYRVDLLFFHRLLRCMVVIDLKIGEFTHADAGQMHMYLNYAREHWMHEGENPPVGIILCAQKDEAVAQYALEGLPNKVMAAEYRTVLPDEDTLAAEIERTREILEQREIAAPPSPRKRGGKRAAMKRRPRSQAKKGKQK